MLYVHVYIHVHAYVHCAIGYPSVSFPDHFQCMGMGIRLHKPVIVGASSDRVMTEVLLGRFLCPKVLQRVRPEEVTHRAKCWGLLETIQLKERKGGREGGREGGRTRWRGSERGGKRGEEGDRGKREEERKRDIVHVHASLNTFYLHDVT